MHSSSPRISQHDDENDDVADNVHTTINNAATFDKMFIKRYTYNQKVMYFAYYT